MKKMLRLIALAAAMMMAAAFSSCAAGAGDKNDPEEGTQEDTQMSVRIEKVVTDGMEMEYFRFGGGDKVMVILPGLSVQSVMGSAEAVAEAYSDFSEEFTVYLFDRRKDLPESYGIADMAEDTLAAFHALGLKDIYLFGASQGGMIALQIAVTEPELISRLAVGSSCASASDIETDVLDRWIALAKEGDRQELYLAFAEALYPRDVYESYRETFIQMAGGVTDEDLSRFVILARGIEGFDVSGRLKDITCPVLAIGAEDDMVLGPGGTLGIARAFEGRADFTLYMYEGYGHACFDTAPDYKQRLLGFFLGQAEQ